MAQIGCNCEKVGGPVQYLACAGVQAVDATDLTVLQSWAAKAGASSGDFSMCLAVACLLAHRIMYWKVQPGDCGSGAYLINNKTASTVGFIDSLAAKGAMYDPEPISKAILTGVTQAIGMIASLFTAHHTAAVKLEEDTLCTFSQTYNQFAQLQEDALAQGKITVEQAVANMETVAGQLNGMLAPIRKGKNAAWGYSIALGALRLYNEQVIYPKTSGGLLGGAGGFGKIGLVAGGGFLAAKLAGVF